MRDAVLVGSIAALLVAVFIAVAEADRLHRAGPPKGGFLRGLLGMLASLGLFFVVSLVTGAAYQIAFDPQGPYPASVPIGFTVGLGVLVAWHLRRRGKRRLDQNAP